MIGRREFITLLGGAAAWPLAARAQQPAMPVIGFVSLRSADASADYLRAFRKGLSETGYVEGQNVTVEYHWLVGQFDRVPAVMADVVRRKVDVIVVQGSTFAVLSAKRATQTIPILFQQGADPIAAGLVTSLDRPGGNVSGAASLQAELAPKLFELLHEMVPTAATIGVLGNPTNPVSQIFERSLLPDLQMAAGALGVDLRLLHASTERDFDAVFRRLAELRAGGLLILGCPLFSDRPEAIGALMFRHRVPAIYSYRGFAAGGGLMSYGANVTEQLRLVGTYTGRILRGEKAGDLPVQLSTRVELVINLKTAKALGLTVPLPLLARADEVIE